MKVFIEPSGTQVTEQGLLLVRSDLVPEPADKTYPIHHVFVPVVTEPYKGKIDALGFPDPVSYQNWLNSLPHIWRVNPCLSFFTPAPELATIKDFTDYIGGVFKPDVVATIDHLMALADSAHYIGRYAKSLAKWSDKKVNPADAVDLIASINDALKGPDGLPLSVSLVSGKVQEVPPGSIDVGAGATNRGGAVFEGYTLYDLTNPANESGTVDTYQAWFNTTGATVRVGLSFLNALSRYECRSVYAWGDVASGSVQTAAPLTLACTAGDFASMYSLTGKLETDTSGGSGVKYASGQHLTVGDATVPSTAANYMISIYGTSTTPVGVPLFMHHYKMLRGQ